MARKILITSGKGGVGKTTICANIGCALSQKELKVLLVDGDIGLNNLDVVLGVENKIIYDLSDVVSGKCRPRQAVVQDPNNENLFILPSNHAYCHLDANGECVNEVLNQLDEYFDYIIIDSPAGIEMGFSRLLNCANEIIVVTTPHLSSIRDADKVIGIVRSSEISLSGVIVNRVRGDLILNGEMLTVENISKYLRSDIIGVVPDDDYISYQLMSGGILKRKAESNLAFGYIANSLHCGSEKLYDCTRKYKGLFGVLKRNLRRWV